MYIYIYMYMCVYIYIYIYIWSYAILELYVYMYMYVYGAMLFQRSLLIAIVQERYYRSYNYRSYIIGATIIGALLWSYAACYRSHSYRSYVTCYSSSILEIDIYFIIMRGYLYYYYYYYYYILEIYRLQSYVTCYRSYNYRSYITGAILQSCIIELQYRAI